MGLPPDVLRTVVWLCAKTVIGGRIDDTRRRELNAAVDQPIRIETAGGPLIPNATVQLACSLGKYVTRL